MRTLEYLRMPWGWIHAARAELLLHRTGSRIRELFRSEIFRLILAICAIAALTVVTIAVLSRAGGTVERGRIYYPYLIP